MIKLTPLESLNAIVDTTLYKSDEYRFLKRILTTLDQPKHKTHKVNVIEPIRKPLYIEGYCSYCDTDQEAFNNYCRNCGTKLDWSDYHESN